MKLKTIDGDKHEPGVRAYVALLSLIQSDDNKHEHDGTLTGTSLVHTGTTQ